MFTVLATAQAIVFDAPNAQATVPAATNDAGQIAGTVFRQVDGRCDGGEPSPRFVRTPVIDGPYKLNDWEDALGHLSKANHQGKVILTMV